MPYETHELSNKSKGFIDNLSQDDLERLSAYLDAIRYYGIIKKYTFDGKANCSNPRFIQGELSKYRSILLNKADPFHLFTSVENGYTYIEYEHLSTEVLKYLTAYYKKYMENFNSDKSMSIQRCSDLASKAVKSKIFRNPVLSTKVKTLKVLDSNRVVAINYINSHLQALKAQEVQKNLVNATSHKLALNEQDETTTPSKFIIHEDGLKSDGKAVVQVVDEDGEINYKYSSDIDDWGL